MARRTQFRSRIVSRRSTDWGFGVDALNLGMSASTKILGSTSLTITEQQTIVRIRGIIHVVLTLATSATDGFLGACGIALVNSDAFAAGVASVPGPQSDANWDNWMWHSYFDVRAVTATLADGVNGPMASQRLVVDSKSMRKWDPAETLVLVLEGTESGVAAVEFNGDTRMLLKAA